MSAARHWPETSCYADLWLELLAVLGHAPEAMLGFCAAQGFEGDQVTFLKPDFADLEALYGLRVTELAIYRDLESHLAMQAARACPVLVEVDAFWLPDAPDSYQREHGKTTVAVLDIVPAEKRLSYIHNRSRAALQGADYDGLVGFGPLPPYAEFLRRTGPALAGAELRAAARQRLARHLATRPRPGAAEGLALSIETQVSGLVERGEAAFHAWAFNTLRQLGAGCELLGVLLRWLDPGLHAHAEACDEAAGMAKALQFTAARAARRGRFAGLRESAEKLAERHRSTLDTLMCEIMT